MKAYFNPILVVLHQKSGDLISFIVTDSEAVIHQLLICLANFTFNFFFQLLIKGNQSTDIRKSRKVLHFTVL